MKDSNRREVERWVRKHFTSETTWYVRQHGIVIVHPLKADYEAAINNPNLISKYDFQDGTNPRRITHKQGDSSYV